MSPSGMHPHEGVLSPIRKGPLGVKALNIALQKLVQKKCFDVDIPDTPVDRRPKFYLNDKIIQTHNNYDLDVMNGSVGTITSIDDKAITIRFNEKEVTYKVDSDAPQDLQLAYAITVHKSQGSEFPCVIAVIHKSHWFMHHRNLLYTAVTRARNTVIIIGDRWGIRNCAKVQRQDKRKTFLSLLLENHQPKKENAKAASF